MQKEAERHNDLTSHDKAILNKIFNPSLPFNDVVDYDIGVDDELELETANVKESKAIEVEGVRAAEKGELDLSIELFTKAIETAPQRASGYNNRAQSWQLKQNIPNALEDLNKALELSSNKGKVACQAFTQRGIIHKFQKNDEAAVRDFEAAGALGSDFAREQVVAMNPYAALCNQLMSDMVRQIKEGKA